MRCAIQPILETYMQHKSPPSLFDVIDRTPGLLTRFHAIFDGSGTCEYLRLTTPEKHLYETFRVAKHALAE